MITRVAAAIIIHQGRILIAQRKDGDTLANKWEFPGGKIEKGETPEECLQREIREEFDIMVEIGDFFGENTHAYSSGTVKLLAYYAAWRKGVITPLVHKDFKWVTPEELSNYDFAPADIPFAQQIRAKLSTKLPT